MLWSLALAAELADLDCTRCHEPVVEQWRGSRHAVATSNPVFQASWRHWPNGWCLECHAPRPQQQLDLLGHLARPGVLQQIPEEPPGTSWQNGVDCQTCHVRDGAVRTSSAPTAAGEAVHPLVQDASFASQATCARCHQFPFQQHPNLPFRYGTTPAQNTVTEWEHAQAAAEGRTCITCHMGSQGHRFPGAHSPAFVRAALSVEVAREDELLTVTVRALDVGHAVPTGDPFRRLELWLCDDPDCNVGSPVAWYKRHLQRTDTSWTDGHDTRVPSNGTRTIRVPAHEAVWWRLQLFYGDRRFEADLPPDEVGYTVLEGNIPRE